MPAVPERVFGFGQVMVIADIPGVAQVQKVL
jgi:hypothetical protein